MSEVLKDYEWKPISRVIKENPPPSAGQTVSEKYPGALGYWCRFFMAVTVTKMISDSVVIAHGPLGCNSSVRSFILPHYEQNFGQGFLHMPSTNMDRDSVVFGGEDNLAETIIQTDRDYKPPLIVIHDNCCAGVIMDDVDAVIRRTQAKVSAKLVFVPSHGFSTCYADNMSMNMPHYVKIMEEPKKIDKDAVNIMGAYKEVFSGCGHVKKEPCDNGGLVEWDRRYPTDSAELARYIEGMGLKVHRVLMSGTYDYVKSAPEAALNTHNCPAWGYPLGKTMREKFGTPMAQHAFPIGIEATNRWIREVAGFMGREKEAERLIEAEVTPMTALWAEAKRKASGKIALIEGVRNALCATTKALALARYAIELGMTPYIFNLQGVFITSKDYVVNYFNEDGVDPLVLDGPYSFGFPINVTDVMADLGVTDDDVVYFPCDVYDFERGGVFDPSIVARVNTGQPFRRAKGAPRYLGYRGTEAITKDLVEGIEIAKRKSKSPIYGRMTGRAFDFIEG